MVAYDPVGTKLSLEEECGPRLKTQHMSKSPAQDSNALDREDGLR
jgi:hypothetical protein